VHALAGFSPSVGIFTRQTGRLQKFFEPPEWVETVLEVPRLGPDRESYGIESVESKEQPGKCLGQPWLEVVQSEGPEEKFRGVLPGSRFSLVGEPRVSQSRKTLGSRGLVPEAGLEPARGYPQGILSSSTKGDESTFI